MPARSDVHAPAFSILSYFVSLRSDCAVQDREPGRRPHWTRAGAGFLRSIYKLRSGRARGRTNQGLLIGTTNRRGSLLLSSPRQIRQTPGRLRSIASTGSIPIYVCDVVASPVPNPESQTTNHGVVHDAA